MTNQHDISININLAGITGRVQRALQQSITMVAIGLNAKEGIAPETLTIPDVTMHHQFSSLPTRTIDEDKSLWETWVLRNGFRDIAEELGGILEEIQTVLAYWKIVTIQKTRTLLVEDWNEIVTHRSQQFHRRTLPQRLEFLEQKYSFTLDPNLIHQALTINAARNCLTHRGGIVSQLDTDTTGKLTLEWSALVLFTKANGKEQEIKLPFFAEAETEISIGTRTKSKDFQLGELVSVTSEEFTQICWTLFKLSASCAQRLEEYGKNLGLSFTNDTKLNSADNQLSQ